MIARTRFPALPPLVVSTSQLSTVGWVATFVTRAGKPFMLLDAPTEKNDRGLRFHFASGVSLYVKCFLPLASEAGPEEARGMPGGVFDPTPLAALDGLGGSHAHALIVRRRSGLYITGNAIEKAIHVPVMEARFPPAPILRSQPLEMVEESLDRTRERAMNGTAAVRGGKDSMPENAMIAVAVLERVAPSSSVTVRRYDEGHVQWNAVWRGLAVEIIALPVPRMP